MTRVLMTGASGFIGSHVLYDLMRGHPEWEFVCVCSWRHRGSSSRLSWREQMEVVTHDLTGPLPNLGDFDLILNLASESHVDRSIARPVAFVENNVSSTLQLLEYARAHEPAMFLQFSTDEVYGATNHQEWDVLRPSNPYAASKAAQEMLAIAWRQTYGVRTIITNSNNVVGVGQDPEKFVPKLAGMIRRGAIVPIHCTNGRPGRRVYNPVGNVTSAVDFLCQEALSDAFPLPPSLPPRFSLGGGEELDNLEMATAVAALLGRELRYELVEADAAGRPGYDEFYGAEHASSLTALGWQPTHQLLTELGFMLQANE